MKTCKEASSTHQKTLYLPGDGGGYPSKDGCDHGEQNMGKEIGTGKTGNMAKTHTGEEEIR